MKKLVLIGGGGHCRSILDSLSHSGDKYDDIVITDTLSSTGKEIYGYKIVGNDDMLRSLFDEGFEYAFVAVGSVVNTDIRENIVAKAKAIGFKFPVIIDPSAYVSEYASIGEGTFVSKKAIINADAKVGKQCIINSGAAIEHGCIMGDYSHISTGSILCGDVHVGNKTLIGAGSVVIQNVSIGNHVIIGARSVVIRNVADNSKRFNVVD